MWPSAGLALSSSAWNFGPNFAPAAGLAAWVVGTGAETCPAGAHATRDASPMTAANNHDVMTPPCVMPTAASRLHCDCQKQSLECFDTRQGAAAAARRFAE